MITLLDKVVYNSAVMRQVRKELHPFIESESASPVFFWGETGCGMGFYAKAIHEASQRSGKFLKILGGLLDEETVKQQFLGINRQRGWLEEANNGTIFLKRLSESTPAVQQFMRRLLGNQSVDGRLEFPRKGDSTILQTNVRFIYSMTDYFDAAIREGVLSRELVDVVRKRGIIIHLPPLRERREDIVSIAENFIEGFNQEYKQEISSFDRKAQKLLTSYNWPGNIDQMKRVLRGIFSQNSGITTITADHLPEHIVNPKMTGDKYIFKLKDGERFTGKILSPFLRIQKKDKSKFRINIEDVIEIIRIEDSHFVPPKFKHFVFRLKDSNRIVADKILDKTIRVGTSFNPSYQVDVQELDAVVLS